MIYYNHIKCEAVKIIKILIVPDSFKGTLSSEEVCLCIKNGLEKTSNENEITSLPFSDGGEGFSACFKNICNGKTLYTECRNIYNQLIDGHITVFENTAVIETAVASGLLKKRNVMAASSYGTGELIKFAVSQGFSNIILGLGGTGCCDGGAGALTALGTVFYDENYKKISFPTGNDMNCIFGASFKNNVKGINFTFATDVENVYYGQNGAAFVFAKQKGANDTQVEELDEGLKRLNAFLPVDISKIKGTGAAGGICGGLYSVYGGEIVSGFDILSKYADLENKIAQSDLIITGEGKTDSQTLMGKLPYKIAKLCEKHGKECVVISGINENIKIGNRCISLVDGGTTPEEAMNNAKEILTKKAQYVLK